MRIARIASLIFIWNVVTFPRIMFFATCWVMVDAPIGRRPLCMFSRSVKAARAIASGSTPLWVQKFWSSAAMKAFFTTSGIAA